MIERDKTNLHTIAMFLECNVSDLEVATKLLDSALEDGDTNSAINVVLVLRLCAIALSPAIEPILARNSKNTEKD